MGFRPRFLVPILVCAAGVLILTGLGVWQLDRRAQKQTLIAHIENRLSAPSEPLPATLTEPTTFDYRRVSVAGRFHHESEFHLQARTHRGDVGVQIVTPLERADGAGVVMINRGWVPLARQDPARRSEGQIAGQVTVTGLARVPAPPGAFQPANDPERNLWFWVDLPAMARAAGFAATVPIVVEADATPNPGGFPIGGQTRVTIANDHLVYAATWFSLALALCGVAGLVLLRLHRSRASTGRCSS